MVPPRGATSARSRAPPPLPGVRAAKSGVVIDLEVSPGASSRIFPAGYNVWRERVEIRVTAPPEKGRANEDVIEAVAAFFNVPVADVSITSGHKDRRKSALVSGIDLDVALALLHAEIAREEGAHE